MIPFFQYNSFLIGPVVIQVWGLMVALGIMAAVTYMVYLAKKYFVSPEVILDITIWSLISGFIGARLFHVIFYNLDYYLAHPVDVLKFWQGGASSLGGFFGAGVAIWIFSKVRHFGWKELLPYFDIMATGLWLGWGIGRLGCFLIHDHPGTLTHFIGAVQFPSGVRHDLGLYESLLGFALFGLAVLIFPKLIKKRWGLVAAVTGLVYAVARFFLDFLRATDLSTSDARYAHLTPAQWGMLVVGAALTFAIIYGTMRQPKKTI